MEAYGHCYTDFSKVFAVIPRAEAGVPIRIEAPRPGDRSRYWDHPISKVKSSDATLEFIDYFDFDHLGYLDFKYVRARITDFPANSGLVGREALLDAEYVDIGVLDK